jgi:hypothetical protein
VFVESDMVRAYIAATGIWVWEGDMVELFAEARGSACTDVEESVFGDSGHWVKW